MHVLTIVGNRPHFIKTAVLSPMLRDCFRETLVHTGQHYDTEMSDLFFHELKIPLPDVNLRVGSGSRLWQIQTMTDALDREMKRIVPDCVIVYGDTDSTIAGVLAAMRRKLPVFHIEAGLRSYNPRMPEEHNRVVADHNAELLFCPSPRCLETLRKEGIDRNAFVVGDLMLDLLVRLRPGEKAGQAVLTRHGVIRGKFSLLTVHRPSNADDLDRLTLILSTLERLQEPILWPVHPRCRHPGIQPLLNSLEYIRPIPPQGYLDFITLLRHARAVLTDSGGVQKEAYWLGTPCLTLREETEWVETLAMGWNVLVGADSAKITAQMLSFKPVGDRPMLYGDGNAAVQILQVLSTWKNSRG
jgi:UDP-GlcNAc3NAcA epimerase